jgi:hypothetical protein
MEKRRRFESEIELPKKLEAKLVKPKTTFATKQYLKLSLMRNDGKVANGDKLTNILDQVKKCN